MCIIYIIFTRSANSVYEDFFFQKNSNGKRSLILKHQTMSIRGLYTYTTYLFTGNALGNVHPIGSDENHSLHFMDYFFSCVCVYSYTLLRNRYWPDTNKKSLCYKMLTGFRMFASPPIHIWCTHNNIIYTIYTPVTSVYRYFSRAFSTRRHRPGCRCAQGPGHIRQVDDVKEKRKKNKMKCILKIHIPALPEGTLSTCFTGIRCL